MICTRCEKAFNGTNRRCHRCGQEHSDPLYPAVEIVVDDGLVDPPVVAVTARELPEVETAAEELTEGAEVTTEELETEPETAD